MEQVVILRRNKNIYARFFRSKKTNLNISIVIAPSLFSENKFSRAFLVNNCRYLCSLGYNVLFFDYCGTGESQGESISMTLRSMSDDLSTGISYLKKESFKNIVLIGFRGGAVPVLSHIQDPSISLLVLWEPVQKGSELIRFSNLMPSKKRFTVSENIGDDNINIGGWEINEIFYKHLKKWRLNQHIILEDSNRIYVIRFMTDGRKKSSKQLLEHNNTDYVESEKFWLFGSNRYFISPSRLTDFKIKKLFFPETIQVLVLPGKTSNQLNGSVNKTN